MSLRAVASATARSAALLARARLPAAAPQLARPARAAAPALARAYASSSGSEGKSGGGALKWLTLLALAAAGGFYVYEQQLETKAAPKPAELVKDYRAVAKELAAIMDAPSDYDDGSYAPLFVRLAWHASGTYDVGSKTGGSNGATIRFSPEANHGANAGLGLARDLLEKVKAKFPWISYADLYTLAGVIAIKEVGGPSIAWRPGRSDAVESKIPDGRLPDASKEQKHLRTIFGRMGFNDQEIVALAGAHALGRCHTTRSGYTGPWTRSPTVLTNDYFKELLNNKWTKKKWNGPEQFEDPTGELMMLPADLSLINDKGFKQHVVAYAADDKKFFADFAVAFKKLLELGVAFPDGTPEYTF